MAWASKQFRQWAQHSPHEPLEQNGVLDRIFARLQQEQMLRINADAFHQSPSRRNRGIKKNGPQSVGRSCGGWTIKLHLIAASAECAVLFSLSPGRRRAGRPQAADGAGGGLETLRDDYGQGV